jgi:polyisoprenoid-binding protein YceI
MLGPRPRPALLHVLIPLSAGAAAFAALCLVGAQRFGWLAFLTAGLAWSTLGRNAVSADTDDVPRAPDHQPGGPPSLSATGPAGVNPTVGETPAVPAGRYVLDAERTAVRIHVRKLGFLTVRGLFTHVSGTIDVDEDPTRSRITAVVPSASLRTGNAYRDAHVVGPAFLDAERHPVIRYEASHPAVDPDGNWRVSGHLTVKGVTQPVTLTRAVVTPLDGGSRLRLTGETTISRGSFGVSAYGWLVGDDIMIRIRAEADRKGLWPLAGVGGSHKG